MTKLWKSAGERPWPTDVPDVGEIGKESSAAPPFVRYGRRVVYQPVDVSLLQFHVVLDKLAGVMVEPRRDLMSRPSNPLNRVVRLRGHFRLLTAPGESPVLAQIGRGFH